MDEKKYYTIKMTDNSITIKYNTSDETFYRPWNDLPYLADEYRLAMETKYPLGCKIEKDMLSMFAGYEIKLIIEQ